MKTTPHTTRIPLLLALLLVGCHCGDNGSGNSTLDDASVPADATPADARIDAAIIDAAPLPDANGQIVGSVWEHDLLQWTKTPELLLLEWALAFDDRVLVVARPEMFLYDSEGNRVGVGPAPAAAGQISVQVQGAVRDVSGAFWVLYLDLATQQLFVHEFANDATLSAGARVDLVGNDWIGAALSVDGSDLLVLGGRMVADEPRLEVIRISAGMAQSEASLATDATYAPHGVGHIESGGNLVVCGVGQVAPDSRVDAVRFDTATKAFSIVPIAPSSPAITGQCYLSPTPGGMLAMWHDFASGEARSAVLNQAADAVLSKAPIPVGPVEGTGLRAGTRRFGSSVLAVDVPLQAQAYVPVLRFDAPTWMGASRWLVPMPSGVGTSRRGSALAATDEFLYLAYTTSAPTGITLRLRRLAP